MRKGIKILIIVFIVQTIASCCGHVKFYDYDSMIVSESDLVIEDGENLELRLDAQNIDFLSFRLSQLGHNQSFAYDCDKGWGGMKHRITDITIVSDSDFDYSHAVGISLDDLFMYSKFRGDGQYEWVELTDLNDYNSNSITLKLKTRPTNGLNHKFFITITKSNSELIKVESNTIEWVE
ncbi:hypothetical protein D770_23440 [Flammeovirgaceae bacterium 311]|nr:hypothetical protein D770_23440 [Flammeovirgaceae bacterium 311]